MFRFIVLFLLFGGSRTVYGLAVAFLAFRERYFDAGAFSFGAGEVELSFMHMHEFPYKKQSDAAAGYFGIDGIAAAEVHLEQLFCSSSGMPIPVSLTSTFQVSSVS